MLTISSNVEDVIAELESLSRLEISFNPESYLPSLKETAETVLLAMLEPDELGAIGAIVSTVVGAAKKMGMEFEAHGLVGEEVGGAPRLGDFDTKLVEQWVREYKDLESERDTYEGGRTRSHGEWQSPETIAERILAIESQAPGTFFHDGKHSGGSLQEFLSGMAGKQGLTGLSEERLVEALTAVLSAWQDLAGARVAEDALCQIEHALNTK